jgi:serine/threonine-protein kinase RsbW/stage II sporulation protein AB (anti-sigma F factor)
MMITGAGRGKKGSVRLCETLDTSYPAVADAVPAARQRVAEYAAKAGLTRERLDAVRLAVSEAVTNAVIHAYRGHSGDVRVAAKANAGELWVFVTDWGCGYSKPAHTPGLGLGLPVMAEAADACGVTERPDGGTEVQLRFQVA